VFARKQKIPQCSLQPGHYIDHSAIFLVTIPTNGVGFGYVSQNFKKTRLIRIFCGSHEINLVLEFYTPTNALIYTIKY